MDQVSLPVLGRFELDLNGRRHEVPWQAQRVLGYLAVGGVAQPRATVAGALWEDVSQRRAKANLRNAVWRVRQLSDRVLSGGRDVIALDGSVALDLYDAQRRARPCYATRIRPSTSPASTCSTMTCCQPGTSPGC